MVCVWHQVLHVRVRAITFMPDCNQMSVTFGPNGNVAGLTKYYNEVMQSHFSIALTMR